MDPLIKAVKSGCLQLVQKTISIRGIPVDSRMLDYLAVNHSIVDEYEHIADYLLDCNCRVKNTNQKAFPHETPLHSAVKRRSSTKLIAKLLKKGACVETLNLQGYSPLHLALVLGNSAAIDAILEHIVSTGHYENVRSKNGLTHFHVACTRHNADAVEGFIEAGVDVDEAVNVDSDFKPGYTARHFAAEFQSLEAVKSLVKKTRGQVLDKFGRSPDELARKSLEDLSVIVYLLAGEGKENKVSQFHLACAQDNPELVKKFIENEATVGATVSEDAVFCPGYSPLHFAVESNCKENVELLLNHDADVECQDANFGTPLHLALYNEDPKEEKPSIVDVLYEKLSLDDKMFNLMDLNGLNYFHIAVTRNEVDLVETFLDAGVDIEHEVLFNARQFAHYRPLHFAIRYKHLEMTELLVERGANVEAISKDGPPLHIAIETGDADLIDLLLENNVKVDAVRQVDGKSMLHSLVETFMLTSNVLLLEFFETLVELGANVNHRDDNGNTALHLACEKIGVGIHCVKLLLEFGADINVENAEGETPFECAFHDLYRRNGASYMLLYHHVQKLKVLGFSMNPRNEVCCQRILDESDECDPNAPCFRMTVLDRNKESRREEVETLKGIQLTKAMSLHSFLSLGKVDAATYVTNAKLQEVMGKDGFDEEFPVYGYLIKLQFLKGSSYLKNARKRNVEDDDDEEVCVKRMRCE